MPRLVGCGWRSGGCDHASVLLQGFCRLLEGWGASWGGTWSFWVSSGGLSWGDPHTLSHTGRGGWCLHLNSELTLHRCAHRSISLYDLPVLPRLGLRRSGRRDQLRDWRGRFPSPGSLCLGAFPSKGAGPALGIPVGSGVSRDEPQWVGCPSVHPS